MSIDKMISIEIASPLPGQYVRAYTQRPRDGHARPLSCLGRALISAPGATAFSPVHQPGVIPFEDDEVIVKWRPLPFD